MYIKIFKYKEDIFKLLSQLSTTSSEMTVNVRAEIVIRAQHSYCIFIYTLLYDNKSVFSLRVAEYEAFIVIVSSPTLLSSYFELTAPSAAAPI